MRHLEDLLAELEAPPPEMEKAWREAEAKKRRKAFRVIEKPKDA